MIIFWAASNSIKSLTSSTAEPRWGVKKVLSFKFNNSWLIFFGRSFIDKSSNSKTSEAYPPMCPELIACAIALSSTTEPLEVLISKQLRL